MDAVDLESRRVVVSSLPDPAVETVEDRADAVDARERDGQTRQRLRRGARLARGRVGRYVRHGAPKPFFHAHPHVRTGSGKSPVRTGVGRRHKTRDDFLDGKDLVELD